jgi:hypothetical protein
MAAGTGETGSTADVEENMAYLFGDTGGTGGLRLATTSTTGGFLRFLLELGEGANDRHIALLMAVGIREDMYRAYFFAEASRRWTLTPDTRSLYAAWAMYYYNQGLRRWVI